MNIQSFRLSSASTTEFQQKLLQLVRPDIAQLAICFGNHQSIRLLADSPELESVAECWLAGSSCHGCADDQGLNKSLPYTASLLLFHDVDGAFGVSSVDLSGDPASQATQALEQAMLNAGKPHELPKLIWCMQAPGHEEIVLASFKNVVGERVPIFGGSSADDNVSGEWVQFDGKTLLSCGLVVAVFYTSTGISNFFSCGYEKLESLGYVTAVNGRELLEIDEQPAAMRYRTALASRGEVLPTAGNVLAKSTFYPLGRALNHNELPLYLLSHPAFITEQQSIRLFSELNIGDELYLMQGDRNKLIKRAASVCRTALYSLKFKYDCDAAGAIIVFCGGCMLAVESELDEVQAAIKQQLGSIPFVVAYTFGEQGTFIDGSNRHGNLMISAVFFGASNARY